jgi:hypothetical protein
MIQAVRNLFLTAFLMTFYSLSFIYLCRIVTALKKHSKKSRRNVVNFLRIIFYFTSEKYRIYATF